MSDEEELSDEELLEEQQALYGSQLPREGGALRTAVYDADALHEKLEDIGWTQEVEWDETLSITSSQPSDVKNIDDDIERELVFYKQALEATLEAIKKFDTAKTPWLRPPDYYAEMVKSDTHMNEVKKQLMYQQTKIEEAEQRRKQRENKQYNKQVQAEHQKQRTQEKKKQVEQISKLRKQRQNSGYKGELDLDAELASMDKQQRNSQKTPDRNFRNNQLSKKRDAKNEKFGFGGRKAGKKQNDATSTSSFGSYKPGKFSDQYSAKLSKTHKGGVNKSKGNRPGKQRRQQKKR